MPYKPKFPCMTCGLAAKWKQKCLQCSLCLSWYHVDCLKMSDSIFEVHQLNKSLEWICHEGCGMPQFWNLDSSVFNYSSLNYSSSSLTHDSSGDLLCTSPVNRAPPQNPPATSSPVDNRTSTSTDSPTSPIPSVNSHRRDNSAAVKKRDEITFMVANCDGVTGKKATLENMLTSLQPDIFLAVESKLDNSIYDAEFLPQPYRDFPPARKDRKRGGGGVFIAVREGIVAEHLTEFDSNCEISWVKVQLQNNNYMIIGVYYRPPNATIDSLYELYNSISKIKEKYPRAKIFLGGDFNLPGIDWESNSHIPLKQKKAECEYLLKTAADFHLEQLNLHATRKENILELFFSSCPETVLSCDTGPGISDHDHILISRVKLKIAQNKKKPREIQLFNKADWTSMKKAIKSSSENFFKNKPEENPVNTNWLYLKTCLANVTQNFVPSKKVSGRYRSPWITGKNKRLIRKKQRAYKRAKDSNSEKDWMTFRKIRKELQKDLKDAHHNYVNDTIAEDGNKGLWRYLKGVRKDSCGVSTLVKDHKVATQPGDKAELLNEQFSSVFTREDPASSPDLGPTPYKKMPPITIGKAGVLKLLKELKTRKASGPDNIPAILLKNCAEELTPILAFIFQQALDQNAVPDDWKTALVTPVFKKGKRAEPANYRPVSLTSIICKINEHIIVSETLSHLERENILVDYQHGFRRRRSCETQLLITSHDLASILNRRSQADVAVLDFAKAFDKVPHQRLLKKLHFYNLDANVIGWIESFLTNRTQRVIVDGYTSNEAPVLSGVPQGTVLGPLLFLIFINDIAKNVSSSIRLFADDCLMYRETQNQEQCQLLQKDLDTLAAWSITWGMAFNVSKCNIISITNATKKKQVFGYSMNNQVLKTVNSTAYLGLTINDKLQWGEHINSISGAANRMLGFLARTLTKCPQKLKEKAYMTAVRPKLEYGAAIWDPHQDVYINKIEMVQRRAARFVRNVPHRRSGPQPSVSAMVSDLGWESLQQRRHNSRIALLYKVKNGLVEVPAEYHPVPNTSRASSRAHNQQYVRQQAAIDAFKFSFLPRTIVDWNKLPGAIVEAESLEDLKRRLSSHQK